MPAHIAFHPVVQHWFESSFEAPSPPQALGWPSIAGRRHTLILAPTGSGKTLAAFLWCIDDLFRAGIDQPADEFARNAEGVHTLYISPLKALNNDIERNLQAPLQGIRQTAKVRGFAAPAIRTLVRTGDTPAHVRRSMVRKPPHILITTPESLYLLLTSPNGREIFRGLRYLIVDEIHALCNNKRGVHLSLSLERLMPLCRQEPVRIGLSATQRPLERIAAYLGGQQEQPETGRLAPRPVHPIDCGQRKDIDLQILCPVANFADLPDQSVWPQVISLLYRLIREHRTTLVFVNMRAQAERIARQLNELHRDRGGADSADIAQAHHGSMSREVRYEIEARLKKGLIPAVVATGSLELGIDIGSIDLVVQLQAPASVATGLQRVGRSGHTLAARSKGRIIPLFRAELDDVIALTACMLKNEIEETRIPENCLDVLAQHIVAETAMRDWPREALFALCRRSYCYRNLAPAVFTNVLEMLSGKYADTQIRALCPRLRWDRVNDSLFGLRGAKLIAVMSGGTIPDTGNYPVYLAGSNTRLGDLNEEFAFERRVGDVFYLGNSEWRIDQITRDRIIVSPVTAARPQPPFWKGGLYYRDFETGKKIAAFRRELLAHVAAGDAEQWVRRIAPVDRDTAANLVAAFQGQLAHAGCVATDRELLCEYFRDAAGEPHVVLHSPFGARVNGAWAIAVAAALEKQFGAEVQFTFDDDGILFRLPDTSEPPPMQKFFRLEAKTLERHLVAAIANTPVFMVYFRQNAVRAMLLPRSREGKRIPLWQQRLRAADLLQAVRRYPDFPVLLETYRDCLEDVFDLPALREIAGALRAGTLRMQEVQTSSPSPMASGLLFDFLSTYLYEFDRARMPGQAAFVSSELLAEILSQQEIPCIVTPEIVQGAEARWQFKTPERRARDSESLFTIIEQLGPISGAELAARCAEPPDARLAALAEAGRITRIEQPVAGWIVSEALSLFCERPDRETARKRLRRCLAVRGPRTLPELAKEAALPVDNVEETLRELYANKDIVRGRLVEGVDAEQFCERQNFAELYRRAIARRRESSVAVDRPAYYRFLLRWHGFGEPEQEVDDILQRYSGFQMPLYFFERELLRSRLSPNTGAGTEKLAACRELLRCGEWYVYGARDAEDSRRHLYFLPGRQGHVLHTKQPLHEAAAALPEDARTVHAFLQENGASFGRDIVDGTALSLPRAETALAKLSHAGLVTCDAYDVFLHILQPTLPKSGAPQAEARPDWPEKVIRQERARGRRPSRSALRHRIQHRPSLRESRWMLTTTFAAFGRETGDRQRAERQARMLLRRYGIVVKACYRRERGLLPWFHIFRALKRLEWQGEICRGYFVEGLSGVQYALPEAVERLRQHPPPAASPAMLSTADPALIFGGPVAWQLHALDGRPLAITRAPGNHLVFCNDRPVAYLENYGTRLWHLRDFEPEMAESIVTCLKSLLALPAHLRARKMLEIQQLDAQPAAATAAAARFIEAGFEKDSDRLVLWPSKL